MKASCPSALRGLRAVATADVGMVQRCHNAALVVEARRRVLSRAPGVIVNVKKISAETKVST